jgi:hypothetical protein
VEIKEANMKVQAKLSKDRDGRNAAKQQNGTEPHLLFVLLSRRIMSHESTKRNFEIL